MNIVIQVLDIVSAFSLILALNMVAKNYKWWRFYAATNAIFMAVAICKGLPGWTIAGFVLFITGIRNYRIGRRKDETET